MTKPPAKKTPAITTTPGPNPSHPATSYTNNVPNSSGAYTASATAPGATLPAVNANGFTTDQQSAFDFMNGLLSEYRLGDLSDTLKQLILAGDTDPNVLSLKLQDTAAWKQRFAGNEMLRNSGHNVLSVDQYLATENSYLAVMKQYGLPAGFYDDNADFAKFIGEGVSPAELQQRASAYADLANREDPAITAQLASLGISQGALAAYMMDPDRAAPLIQRMYTSTLVGAAARRNGLIGTDVGHLADIGVTEQQAIQGYGEIAQELPTLTKLGDIYHQDITQSDLEGAIFDSNAADLNKRKKLASQERASFTGSSGIVQGSLNRNTSGSY